MYCIIITIITVHCRWMVSSSLSNNARIDLCVCLFRSRNHFTSLQTRVYVWIFVRHFIPTRMHDKQNQWKTEISTFLRSFYRNNFWEESFHYCFESNKISVLPHKLISLLPHKLQPLNTNYLTLHFTNDKQCYGGYFRGQGRNNGLQSIPLYR